jgi:sugar phosphate isomerase/epimerase
MKETYCRARWSRRGFLATLAAGTASLASGLRAGSGGLDRKKVLVGAHPWVYAAPLPRYDITPVLPTLFADFEYAGFDEVELMHTALRPDDAVERIGALSQKHRLPIVGTSFSGTMWDRSKHAEVLRDAELIVPRLAKLAGRTLGTSVESPGRRKTEQELDAQAELLRKLISLCSNHGVMLNLHNHTYEVSDNLHDLKGTLARIPDVKLGPDLNWLVRGGADPVWFIRTYGKQIVFLHLRNQYQNGLWSESLGEGDMDYPAIAQALKDVGFTGDAVVELAHERDFKLTRPLRESWKMSRQFVREKLGY